MPDTILKNRNFISLTCMNSPITSVCKDIEDLLFKHSFKLKIIKVDPQNTILEMPYQNQNKIGFILWEPKNTNIGCAFMVTIQDGWYTLIYNIATKYRHDCLSIRVSSTMEEYPICELQYYEHGKEKRFIRSMKDEPKWEFYQKGKQLTFEKPDHYNKRRIKDRFNEELLLEYLHALGWDIRKNTFWETEKPYYKA